MPEQTARATFARNLRRARVAQGLSQEALAAKAGVHRTYVGAVERQEVNISVDNMERLASAVGRCLADLLRGGRK
ncbi:MAG: helix-turn-helix transcriptional regulator [Gemmatimonadota bacterium]